MAGNVREEDAAAVIGIEGRVGGGYREKESETTTTTTVVRRWVGVGDYCVVLNT